MVMYTAATVEVRHLYLYCELGRKPYLKHPLFVSWRIPGLSCVSLLTCEGSQRYDNSGA
jgi:hypothetical protein